MKRLTLRRLYRWLLTSLAIVVAVCIGLAVYLIGPTTMRLADPQLLIGMPAALVEASKPAASVAERQASGGPLDYQEQFIPGAAGDPPVRIVIVSPKNAAAGRPGLLDLHGGGYRYGSPESSLDLLVETLVTTLGVTAVSVDYRLAPGTRYPGSLHDNYAALKWFHNNAALLGVDPQRIGVVGFSAGGGHAAALSILARDRGEVPILFQALVSPMLDDRTGATVEPGDALGRFLWTRENNRDGWSALLGVNAGSDAVAAEAVPMRVGDLAGLPPTYVSVGDLDLFAPECVAFAGKLEAAGVAVESHVFPGAFHGFELLVPKAAVSRQSWRLLLDYMARHFGPAGEKS